MEYFQIELDTPDVIIAGCSLSESFIGEDIPAARPMGHEANALAAAAPAPRFPASADRSVLADLGPASSICSLLVSPASRGGPAVAGVETPEQLRARVRASLLRRRA